MSRQSTRAVLMIEPSQCGYNPQTASTNDYQLDARETPDAVQKNYIAEFRTLRDALVTSGVCVTTLRGPMGCPDSAFPNWFSTHQNGVAVLYPMLAENRRSERSLEAVGFLRKFYTVKDDLTAWE
jgi:hypothetical protein